MISSARVQRKYDHRLQEMVRSSGRIELAVQRGVPDSTARGWLKASTAREVVSFDVLDRELCQLQRELVFLRRRVKRLTAIIRLVIAVLKVTGFSLANFRITDDNARKRLFAAIKLSKPELPLRISLGLIGLSQSRYHAWNASEPCTHISESGCPKRLPQQLTATELLTIQEMVTSGDYRHVPTGVLARLAQRLGRVFASPATWYRLVREHKWRRPRTRRYPAKPKVGIRAKTANEIWHVDTTLIRLLDGSRAYLHAVIDNFSRRILAWHIDDRFNPLATAVLMQRASSGVENGKPTVLVDGGVENFNATVDEIFADGTLKRVLAQTDISFSNSMIESWWRVLKHQWLYLNNLDSVETVRKLVAFYVEQHNRKLPHAAFKGQTPDEMYFGTGESIPEKLQSQRLAARAERIKHNREQKCSSCAITDLAIPQ